MHLVMGVARYTDAGRSMLLDVGKEKDMKSPSIGEETADGPIYQKAWNSEGAWM